MYILVHVIVEEGKESLWVSIYTSACNSGGGEGVFVVSVYTSACNSGGGEGVFVGKCIY